MQTVLDTLVNQDGFTQQVQQLQQLIESLQDQDGDGVNDLQQVKDRLDALESSYQTQQTQLNQHGQQITNLQTTQASQGQQIATLQTAVDNLDWETLGLDPNQIRCEAVTDIYNAMEAGFQAFQARLNINCVLPESLDQVNTQPPSENNENIEDDVPDTL